MLAININRSIQSSWPRQSLIIWRRMMSCVGRLSFSCLQTVRMSFQETCSRLFFNGTLIDYLVLVSRLFSSNSNNNDSLKTLDVCLGWPYHQMQWNQSVPGFHWVIIVPWSLSWVQMGKWWLAKFRRQSSTIHAAYFLGVPSCDKSHNSNHNCNLTYHNHHQCSSSDWPCLIGLAGSTNQLLLHQYHFHPHLYLHHYHQLQSLSHNQ